MFKHSIFSVLLLASTVSFAKNVNSGEFLGAPQGILITDEKTGKTLFKLSQDYEYVDSEGTRWVTPKNYESDGASIPNPLKSFTGGSFDQRHIFASIIHDYYSCMRIRDEFKTHEAFYFGLLAKGIKESRALDMFKAVVIAGPSWPEPPADRVEIYDVVVGPNCAYDEDGWEGKPGNQFYPYDPEPGFIGKLDEALSVIFLRRKSLAMSRVLLASDGEYFDIDASGNRLEANLKTIFNRSKELNLLIKSSDLAANPSLLGILATDNLNDLDRQLGNPELLQGWDTLSDDFVNSMLTQNQSLLQRDLDLLISVDEGNIFDILPSENRNIVFDNKSLTTKIQVGTEPAKIMLFPTNSTIHSFEILYPNNIAKTYTFDLQSSESSSLTLLVPTAPNLPVELQGMR